MLQTNQFKQILHESIRKMAELIAQETAGEKELQPVKARQKQVEHDLENHVKVLEKKMYEGLQAATSCLKECDNLPMSVEEVVRELQNCMKPINSPEALSKLGQQLFSDVSWKNHLGISDKCMETLYQGAKHIFDKKDYIQGEKAFFLICSLDPTQFAYWVGLGHSAFHNKNHEQAINAYGMASTLHPEDAWPHIWAANTFEEEKDFAHSKMALSEALNLEKAKTGKNHDLISSLEERFQNSKAR
jgi:tetratricopeptide (TPR) repeat protein